MPLAVVAGCDSYDGYAMAQYLMYRAFETRCEGPGERIDVAVIASSARACPGWALDARVTAADRGAALRCGGELGRLAGAVEPPVYVRVDPGRGILVYWGPGSVFVAWRELDRLLASRGLLYTTPPISGEEILRYRPR